jgi:hypothetical protein
LLARHRVGDELVVVAPALLSRLRYWASDDGEARRAAAARVDAWLAALTAGSVQARGHVGDSAPLQAIADEVSLVDPDEVVIVPPSAAVNWQARDLVERARRRFTVPIARAA